MNESKTMLYGKTRSARLSVFVPTWLRSRLLPDHMGQQIRSLIMSKPDPQTTLKTAEQQRMEQGIGHHAFTPHPHIFNHPDAEIPKAEPCIELVNYLYKCVRHFYTPCLQGEQSARDYAYRVAVHLPKERI
jgi:hypothetical protein